MCSCVIVCSLMAAENILALNCRLPVEKRNSDCNNSDDDPLELASCKHVRVMNTPNTPLLYCRTGVYSGIHYFLIYWL